MEPWWNHDRLAAIYTITYPQPRTYKYWSADHRVAICKLRWCQSAATLGYLVLTCNMYRISWSQNENNKGNVLDRQRKLFQWGFVMENHCIITKLRTIGWKATTIDLEKNYDHFWHHDMLSSARWFKPNVTSDKVYSQIILHIGTTDSTYVGDIIRIKSIRVCIIATVRWSSRYTMYM